jgi:hypothetical protein
MLFRLMAQESGDPKGYPAQKGDPQAKVRVAANVGDGQERGQHPNAEDSQAGAQSLHWRLFSLAYFRHFGNFNSLRAHWGRSDSRNGSEIQLPAVINQQNCIVQWFRVGHSDRKPLLSSRRSN